MLVFAQRPLPKPEPAATAASDSNGRKIFKEALKTSQKIYQ